MQYFYTKQTSSNKYTELAVAVDLHKYSRHAHFISMNMHYAHTTKVAVNSDRTVYTSFHNNNENRIVTCTNTVLPSYQK